VPAGTMKIHKHAIRIHRHNNNKYINYSIKQEYNDIYTDKKIEPKDYISSNFILSICLLITFDTLSLGPSLHCNLNP
jgi:hypothetical protein